MKRARAAWTMALTTRVMCNKEGDGNGGKSNGNEGDRPATAIRAMASTKATTWAMAMATRLAGSTEGKGDGGKVNGNVDEGSGQQQGQL
jgi:hypothetical protein